VSWTKEKPKTPGWYWLRANGMATGVPIEVVEVSGECRMKLNAADITVTVPCAIIAMEWAGPIPKPAGGEAVRIGSLIFGWLEAHPKTTFVLLVGPAVIVRLWDEARDCAKELWNGCRLIWLDTREWAKWSFDREVKP